MKGASNLGFTRKILELEIINLAFHVYKSRRRLLIMKLAIKVFFKLINELLYLQTKSHCWSPMKSTIVRDDASRTLCDTSDNIKWLNAQSGFFYGPMENGYSAVMINTAGKLFDLETNRSTYSPYPEGSVQKERGSNGCSTALVYSGGNI